MSVKIRYITAEELERMPEGDDRVELVRGEVVREPPAGYHHGRIAIPVAHAILNYLEKNNIGFVMGADTGFVLSRDPDTVRAPDMAYVSSERAAQQKRKEGFFVGAPDLAVEVVSPDDTAGEVEGKVLDYLQAGSKLVWVIHPKTETVTVYRPSGEVKVLTINDTLKGGDVLPGFELAVKDIFEPLL